METLHNVINFYALFNVSVDVTCASNAVHKVPIVIVSLRSNLPGKFCSDELKLGPKLQTDPSLLADGSCIVQYDLGRGKSWLRERTAHCIAILQISFARTRDATQGQRARSYHAFWPKWLTSPISPHLQPRGRSGATSPAVSRTTKSNTPNVLKTALHNASQFFANLRQEMFQPGLSNLSPTTTDCLKVTSYRAAAAAAVAAAE